MNGTFYTNDALVHAGHVSSKACPFCGLGDSKFHPLWECSHFVEERRKVPLATQQQIRALPGCFHLHGWVTESLVVKQYRRALFDIPDTRHEVVGKLPEGTLNLFTDGACLAPWFQELAWRLGPCVCGRFGG